MSWFRNFSGMKNIFLLALSLLLSCKGQAPSSQSQPNDTLTSSAQSDSVLGVDDQPELPFDTTYSFRDDDYVEHHVRITDFNDDGAVDKLSYSTSSGSGFGGRFISVTDGKTGKLFEVNTYGCFCQIRREVFFPKGIDTSFRKAIESVLPERKTSPDGSLAWIIHGLFNQQKIPGNTHFKKCISFPNEWQGGHMELPSVYTLEMQVDSMLVLHEAVEELENLPLEKDATSLLLYYGHNHFDKTLRGSERIPELVTETPDYQIWKTQHGLLAKKGASHKWIFVTDQSLTGAPQKLRWASIGAVRLDGQFVFLEQVFPLDEKGVLWVIDIENGICGQSASPANVNALSSAQISTLKAELLQISN